jgi:hypothetical protein
MYVIISTTQLNPGTLEDIPKLRVSKSDQILLKVNVKKVHALY